jgi:SsrA-binding protein
VTSSKAFVRVVARNRKARHEFFLDDRVEAGIVLVGSEVKSLRAGRGSIVESYAAEQNGEIYLLGAHIPEYAPAAPFNHAPLRPRKLLLHRREMDKLLLAVRRKGVTLVPLALYFNDRGVAKVELAVATGKRKHDKREAEKARDWGREKERLLRESG